VTDKNGKQRVSKDPKPIKIINTDPNDPEDYTSSEDEITNTNIEPDGNNPPPETTPSGRPTLPPLPEKQKHHRKNYRGIHSPIRKPTVYTQKTTLQGCHKRGRNLYPRTEREGVVEFDILLKQPTALTCNCARNVISKMLIDRKYVSVAPFVNARFPYNKNLILTTLPIKNNMEYKAS
jgi:hypothetical protein